jgi:hypothetical protein
VLDGHFQQQALKGMILFVFAAGPLPNSAPLSVITASTSGQYCRLRILKAFRVANITERAFLQGKRIKN